MLIYYQPIYRCCIIWIDYTRERSFSSFILDARRMEYLLLEVDCRAYLSHHASEPILFLRDARLIMIRAVLLTSHRIFRHRFDALPPKYSVAAALAQATSRPKVSPRFILFSAAKASGRVLYRVITLISGLSHFITLNISYQKYNIGIIYSFHGRTILATFIGLLRRIILLNYLC